MIHSSLLLAPTKLAGSYERPVACTASLPLVATACGGTVSLWHVENTACFRRSYAEGSGGNLQCTRVRETERMQDTTMDFQYTSNNPVSVGGQKETGTPVQLFHSSPVRSMAWLRHADDASGLLACVTGQGVHVYRIQVPCQSNASILGAATPKAGAGKQQYAVEALFQSQVAHTDHVNACIFASDRLVTASDDHTVKVWDMDGFTLDGIIRCRSQAVALTKNPVDSSIIAIGEASGHLGLYDARSRDAAVRFRAVDPSVDTAQLTDVDWCPTTPTLMGVTSGDHWWVWDVRRTDKPVLQDVVRVPGESLCQFRWSLTSPKLFATAGSSGLRVWDLSSATSPVAQYLPGGTGAASHSIGSVGWLPDSLTATITEGTSLHFMPLAV